MYMGGLYGKIAALMSADDFETLDAAIVKARKIEAGQYYDKQEPTNQALDDLTKKMQQMAVNYKKLTTALSARVETAGSQAPSSTYWPQVRQYPSRQTRNEGVTCYNCGERGHISRNCLAERRQSFQNFFSAQTRNTTQSRNINMCDIVTNGGNPEVYAMKRRERPEAETNWDERLRKRVASDPNQHTPTPQPTAMEEIIPEPTINLLPIPVKATNRTRRHRGPSVVDLIPPYNIAEDLLSQHANATYGQLLQVPKQRNNLSQALKRPIIPQTETNQ